MMEEIFGEMFSNLFESIMARVHLLFTPQPLHIMSTQLRDVVRYTTL